MRKTSKINLKTTSGPKKKPDDRSASVASDAHSEQDKQNPPGADWEQPKELVKPADQLQLTQQELEEDITKILKAVNPNAPQNIARFSYYEKTYKLDPTVEQTAFHYREDSKVIPIDSEEAKMQDEEKKNQEEADAEAAQEIPTQAHAATSTEDKDDDDDEPSTAVTGSKPLKNQFNFSERASQTMKNPERERGIVTEPPPIVTFDDTATQWGIYDAYMEEIEQQNKNKTKDKKISTEEKKEAKPKTEQEILRSTALMKNAKLIERMVQQNAMDEIIMDFKYWNDPADEFNSEVGSLLPLWTFTHDKARKKAVTSIAWNPQYFDLFAVGYGSYDFLKQSWGMICCYSLKNPSYPEYQFTTESGVLCLDFHPKYPSLLAVGLYDGTVMIFDVRQKQNKPIFQSTIKTGKHTDPVWQVYWQDEDLSQSLNFFSVASDGRVTNWIVAKNELQYTNIMELKLIASHESTSDQITGHSNGQLFSDVASSTSSISVQSTVESDATLIGLAGGCCFDFNRANDHLFIVGTEEGKIHLCSKAYNSQYLETFEGHYMSVYTVRWNPFHSRVFISASADWTVNIWEQGSTKPLMSFDLGSPVSDVAWAPFSSTVFAAVTSSGKVYVFDINQNKHEPMYDQPIVRKAKLTHIEFNARHPVILVGDSRGTVQSLKLSPNLRKLTAPMEGKTKEESEVAKLQAILDFAAKAK